MAIFLAFQLKNTKDSIQACKTGKPTAAVMGFLSAALVFLQLLDVYFYQKLAHKGFLSPIKDWCQSK